MDCNCETYEIHDGIRWLICDCDYEELSEVHSLA